MLWYDCFDGKLEKFRNQNFRSQTYLFVYLSKVLDVNNTFFTDDSSNFATKDINSRVEQDAEVCKQIFSLLL